MFLLLFYKIRLLFLFLIANMFSSSCNNDTSNEKGKRDQELEEQKDDREINFKDLTQQIQVHPD